MTGRERPKPTAEISLFDGIPREREYDSRLNALCHATFNSPAGKEFLNYLQNITIRMVFGRAPALTDQELRELEGKRKLVTMVMHRIEAYESERKRNAKT